MDAERSQLFNLIYGYISTHLISAACKLRLFDAIGEQSCTSADLAKRISYDENSLRRLIKALASFDLLEWMPPSGFRATKMGLLLRQDTPESFYPAVETGFDGLTRDRAWHALAEAVRTGGIAFDIGLGESFFSYLERHPPYKKTFYGAMESSLSKVIQVTEPIDFGRFSSVSDIGGANGRLLQSIHSRFPSLECAIFDREALLGQTPSTEVNAIPASQFRFIVGDFFSEIPSGFDCYMLSRIIDDWSDSKATLLLRNVRAACALGTSLFIIQPVTASFDASFDATIADINMLVYRGVLNARLKRLCNWPVLPALISRRSTDLKKADISHLSFMPTRA